MSIEVCNPSQGRENLKNVSKCHFLNLNGWIVKRACVSHAVKPWHLFDSNFKRIPLIYWCGHFLFPRSPHCSPCLQFRVLRWGWIVKSECNRGTCPTSSCGQPGLCFAFLSFYILVSPRLNRHPPVQGRPGSGDGREWENLWLFTHILGFDLTRCPNIVFNNAILFFP